MIRCMGGGDKLGGGCVIFIQDLEVLIWVLGSGEDEALGFVIPN